MSPRQRACLRSRGSWWGSSKQESLFPFSSLPVAWEMVGQREAEGNNENKGWQQWAGESQVDWLFNSKRKVIWEDCLCDFSGNEFIPEEESLNKDFGAGILKKSGNRIIVSESLAIKKKKSRCKRVNVKVQLFSTPCSPPTPATSIAESCRPRLSSSLPALFPSFLTWGQTPGRNKAEDSLVQESTSSMGRSNFCSLHAHSWRTVPVTGCLLINAPQGLSRVFLGVGLHPKPPCLIWFKGQWQFS